MEFRTDLALEEREASPACPGVRQEQAREGGCTVTRLAVESGEAARALRKPPGNYITLEFPPFSDHVDSGAFARLAARELRALLPPEGAVLVAGLGNRDITPDAVGPLAAGGILATRHLRGEWARAAGLERLRPVAAVSPGVLGSTGLEAAEQVLAVVRQIRPAAVVAIDALAARSLSRLGCTVQICDTGIAPGSGVQNARPRLDRGTLGVPVVALGVPTVVDAATLARELLGCAPPGEAVAPRGAPMFVAPREIDLLVHRAAALAALAVNLALQPELSPEDLRALTA